VGIQIRHAAFVGDHYSEPSSPAVSSKGMLAFFAAALPNLGLLDTVTGIETQAALPKDATWPVAWSPDGSRLYFHDDAGIGSARPDGTGFRQVVKKPTQPECYSAFSLATSANGKLAYSWDGCSTYVRDSNGRMRRL
jgi:hypothetical protein